MKKKLGEILIASGVVAQADIDEALSDQRAGESARLGDQLIALGRLTSFQLAKALATQHGLPYMGLPAIPPRVMAAIPLDYQRTHRLVPFRLEGDTVWVAVADPSNTDAVEELRYSLNRRVVVTIAPGDEIDAVHQAYSSAASPAPVAVKKFVSRPTPAPTAEELFGSMNLDSLDDPVPEAPAAPDDLGNVSVEEDVNFDDPPDEAPAPQRDPGHAEESIEVNESFDDEVSFQSSPSSLESLVIEPNVPVLPDRVAASQARPAPVAPPKPPTPSGPTLPDWLKSSDSQPKAKAPALAPPEAAPPPAAEPVEWSGKLDDVPPSRLIVATVKALVTNGVISEQAILDVLAKK